MNREIKVPTFRQQQQEVPEEGIATHFIANWITQRNEDDFIEKILVQLQYILSFPFLHGHWIGLWFNPSYLRMMVELLALLEGGGRGEYNSGNNSNCFSKYNKRR